jgi:hypothetical protein
VSFDLASASCNLVIKDPLGDSAISYDSVPITWGSNPLTFNSVSGFLVLYNQTDAWFANYEALYPDSDPKIIIVGTYPGYERPYVDERIVIWQRLYRPVAAIFFGGMSLHISYKLLHPVANFELVSASAPTCRIRF